MLFRSTLLLSSRTNDKPGAGGHMKLLATESNVGALFRMLGATWRGTLGQHELAGVHFQQGDEIRIEGKRSNVILDGEDRKSVVQGQSVSVRVDLGGRRIIKTKNK